MRTHARQTVDEALGVAAEFVLSKDRKTKNDKEGDVELKEVNFLSLLNLSIDVFSETENFASNAS